MIVMLKSKALGESQKNYNETLEKALLNLFHTLTNFFKKKHKIV